MAEIEPNIIPGFIFVDMCECVERNLKVIYQTREGVFYHISKDKEELLRCLKCDEAPSRVFSISSQSKLKLDMRQWLKTFSHAYITYITSSLVTFRDRFRTVLNVLGDAIGAGIVEHLSRDELREADQSKMEEGEKEGEGTELIQKPEGRDADQMVSNI